MQLIRLKDYLERKQISEKLKSPFRVLCKICLQPEVWCYCSKIKPFDSKITFAILIHPIELRRRIASGRMSYLSLKNSYLIQGQNYSKDPTVNRLIADPAYCPVILYPGKNSANLSSLSETQKKIICPQGKRLLIFVVDGTWSTASKTVLRSSNLSTLPQISFSPLKPSGFLVRKQPNDMYYSTIEAIHQTIDLLGASQGFDVESRQHDRLLSVFDSFVTQQFNYLNELKMRGEAKRRRVSSHVRVPH